MPYTLPPIGSPLSPCDETLIEQRHNAAHERFERRKELLMGGEIEEPCGQCDEYPCACEDDE